MPLPAGLALPAVDRELGSPPGRLQELPGPGSVPARTHYTLTGPADGQLVILVHGINGFCFQFGLLKPALEDKGYRVLAYDLYGRGYSPRPRNARYTLPEHVEQLEQLLTALGLADQPKSIIAHSMGGLIAVAYAVAHPEIVSLVLMAPAGVMKPPFPGFSAAQTCLGACSCCLPAVAPGGDPPPGDFHKLEDARVAELNDWATRWVRAHMAANGKMPFAYCAARMPLTRGEANVRRMGAPGSAYPVLLLRGEHDPMVTIRQEDLQVYREALGTRLTHHDIPGTAHSFFLEEPGPTHEVLLKFLSDSSASAKTAVL